jgi:hypothetical protein
MIPIFLFLFLSKFLNNFVEGNELYIPYSDYKNPSINSIHGTGNRTLDIIYREKCAKLCGEENYSDEHCCEGNTLEEEKCQSFKRCQEILDNFQHYVIGIALLSYLCLMVITMVIVFILYYCYTRDKYYKCKNAFSSSIIVLFAATVIPIAILQFYCWYKIITIEQFFGANFDKCFNIGNSMQSVEVKNDQRPEIRNVDIDNYRYREKPDFKYEEKFYENNDNIAAGQKSSVRSNNRMLGEDKINNDKLK